MSSNFSNRSLSVTNTPNVIPQGNTYSVLDLQSTDRGMLAPRLTTVQRLALSTAFVASDGPSGAAEQSLLVFDTNDKLYYYWDSTLPPNGQWVSLSAGTPSVDLWQYNAEPSAGTTTTLAPTPAPTGTSPSNFVAPLPTTSTEQNGSFFMFDYTKSAFRAGSVLANEWQNANRGLFSLVLGDGGLAAGSWTTIIGGTTVRAIDSTSRRSAMVNCSNSTMATTDFGCMFNTTNGQMSNIQGTNTLIGTDGSSILGQAGFEDQVSQNVVMGGQQHTIYNQVGAPGISLIANSIVGGSGNQITTTSAFTYYNSIIAGDTCLIQDSARGFIAACDQALLINCTSCVVVGTYTTTGGCALSLGCGIYGGSGVSIQNATGCTILNGLNNAIDGGTYSTILNGQRVTINDGATQSLVFGNDVNLFNSSIRCIVLGNNINLGSVSLPGAQNNIVMGDYILYGNAPTTSNTFTWSDGYLGQYFNVVTPNTFNIVPSGGFTCQTLGGASFTDLIGAAGAYPTNAVLAEPSAILQASSTQKGFLMPVMSDGQRTAIAGPAQGLMVYQSAVPNAGIWFYEPSLGGWTKVGTGDNIWEWSTYLVVPSYGEFNEYFPPNTRTFTSIQNAIDAANSAYTTSGDGRRRLVLIRPGTYLTNSLIDLKEGVDLMAAEPPTATLSYQAAYTKTTPNVIIQDTMRIKITATNLVRISGIRFEQLQNVLPAAAVVLPFDNASPVSFTDCSFQYYTAAQNVEGAVVIQCVGTEVYFTNCDFNNNFPAYALMVDVSANPTASGLLIVQCTECLFRAGVRGITDPANPLVVNFRFQNCQIADLINFQAMVNFSENCIAVFDSCLMNYTSLTSAVNTPGTGISLTLTNCTSQNNIQFSTFGVDVKFSHCTLGGIVNNSAIDTGQCIIDSCRLDFSTDISFNLTNISDAKIINSFFNFASNGISTFFVVLNCELTLSDSLLYVLNNNALQMTVLKIERDNDTIVFNTRLLGCTVQQYIPARATGISSKVLQFNKNERSQLPLMVTNCDFIGGAVEVHCGEIFSPAVTLMTWVNNTTRDEYSLGVSNINEFYLAKDPVHTVCNSYFDTDVGFYGYGNGGPYTVKVSGCNFNRSCTFQPNLTGSNIISNCFATELISVLYTATSNATMNVSNCVAESLNFAPGTDTASNILWVTNCTFTTRASITIDAGVNTKATLFTYNNSLPNSSVAWISATAPLTLPDFVWYTQNNISSGTSAFNLPPAAFTGTVE